MKSMSVKGGSGMGCIIASCQTGFEDVDFHIARQAALGGAVMLRTQNIDRLLCLGLPIIGLKKMYGNEVFITPGTTYIDAVKKEGADIVAIDCTGKNRERNYLTKYAHDLGLAVVADIASIEDMGGKFECDYIATTLSPIPADIDLVKDLAGYDKKIIAEGGFASIGDVEDAMFEGADFVCIGKWFEELVSETIGEINARFDDSI